MNRSEDQVKRLGLNFLREYYKNRGRSFSHKSSIARDQVTPDGLVIDGMLTYKLEDGKTFFALLDATSWDRADELKYSIDSSLRYWDISALTLLITFISSVLAANNNWIGGAWMSNIGFLSFLVVAFLASMVLCTIVLWSSKRYFRIWSVEQFKQLFGQEHWIFVDKVVFDVLDYKYFKELYRQCTNQGIGFAMLNPEGLVDLKLTPDRVPQRKKSIVPAFHNQSDEHATGYTESFLKGDFASAARKFRRTYLPQGTIILLSMLGILGVYHGFNNQRPINDDQSVTMTHRLEELSKVTHPEIADYWIDSSFIYPYVRDAKSYKLTANTSTFAISQPTNREQPRVFILCDSTRADAISAYWSLRKMPHSIQTRLGQPTTGNFKDGYLQLSTDYGIQSAQKKIYLIELQGY